MKLATWNVNGIRACAKKGMFEFLEAQDFDIFCVQETKAHPDQVSPEFIRPWGRVSHWSSAEKRGYSGVATFLKKDVVNVEKGIGIRKFDSEGRFVITDHDDFVLFNVYFPNGASGPDRHEYKQEFLKKFLAHLAKLHKSGREIVLVGDYNVAYMDIDVYDFKSNEKVSGFLPEERLWFRNFLESGFVDTYRHFHPKEEHRYTWWSYMGNARTLNQGWRIDHICVTKNLLKRIRKVEILDDQMGSDHCPVVIDFD